MLPGELRLNHSWRAARQLNLAPSQRTAMGTSSMGVSLVRKPSAAAMALPIQPQARLDQQQVQAQQHEEQRHRLEPADQGVDGHKEECVEKGGD